MTLRENFVYRLPNGREVVALKPASNQWLLKNLREQEFEIPEYRIDKKGRLLIKGKLTAWSIEDLSEANSHH